MKFRFAVAFLLAVAVVPSFNAFSMTKDQEKFFEMFTSKKRNINRIKLKYLKEFFKIIGLSEKKAEAFYEYKLQNGDLTSMKDLKNIEGFTEDDINTLEMFFYAVPSAEDVDVESYITVENEEKSDDVEEQYEILEDLRRHPINLNLATYDDLMKIPWMKPDVARSILDYRRSAEGFKNVAELIDVPGVGMSGFRKIAPFVFVDTGEAMPEKLHGEITFRFSSRVPFGSSSVKPEELTNCDSTSRSYLYTKSEFQFGNNFTLYFTGDRKVSDYLPSYEGIYPAEWFAERPELLKIFNEYTYAFEYRTDSLLDKAIFGAYSLRIGSGLLFDTSFSPQITSIDTYPIIRRNSGLRVHRSASIDSDSDGKADIFNGLAVQLKGDWGRVIGFYSSQDEYYKYPAKTTYGGNIQYRIGNFTYMGLAGFHEVHDDIVESSSSTYTNSYRGRSLTGVSSYFNTYFRGITVAGEVAYTTYPVESEVIPEITGETRSDWAVVVSAVSKISRNLRTSFLIRRIGDTFESPYGGIVLQSKDDEIGFFHGVRLRIGKFKIQTYADFYRKLDVRKFNEEYEFKLKTRPFYKGDLTVKENYKVIRTSYGKDVDQRQIKTRVDMVWNPKRTVKMQIKVENTTEKDLATKATASGNYITVKLGLNPSKILKLLGSFSVYKTDEGVSVYIYQDSLPGWIAPAPSFSGYGYIFTFMANATVLKAKVGVKYSATVKQPESEGYFYDVLKTIRHEVQTQVVFRF